MQYVCNAFKQQVVTILWKLKCQELIDVKKFHKCWTEKAVDKH